MVRDDYDINEAWESYFEEGFAERSKEMKIEEGKFYTTATGLRVGPMTYRENVGVFSSPGYSCYWGGSGKFIGIRGHGFNLDLVSEWHDSPSQDGPVRTVEKREIVPGQYGCVQIIRKHQQFVKLVVPSTSYTAAQLRHAARIFTELAEALEQEDGV